MSNKYLTYAIKEGRSTHISEVKSGLECKCICPACGELLVAKKGKKRGHHFAHKSGENCEYGYETSLHLAAKEALLQCKEITIPPVYLSFPNENKECVLISPKRKISIDDVMLEKRCGDVIPDIVVVSGGKVFFLEIYVTHKVDETKLDKIKKLNVSTIEIDLSQINKVVSMEDLMDIFSKGRCMKWVYNVKEQERLNQYLEESVKRKVLFYPTGKQVDNCPRNIRHICCEPYAYLLDCRRCEFCISFTDEDVICYCASKESKSTALENKEAVLVKCPHCGDEVFFNPSRKTYDCRSCSGHIVSDEKRRVSRYDYERCLG